MLRLQHALGEYFPAALAAFDDFTAADTLQLLAKAPDPVSAARLTRSQITAALAGAGRHHRAEKTEKIRAALRAAELGQPEEVSSAHAAMVRSLIALIQVLNTQINSMELEVTARFGQHPDAEIYLSQPGFGQITEPGCLPSSETMVHVSLMRALARTTQAAAH